MDLILCTESLESWLTESADGSKIAYVCAVDSTFGVRLPEEVRAASEAGAPPYRGRGQPPKERPSPLYTAREVIGSVPEEEWQRVSWSEGRKGALSKQMVLLRVHRATGSDRHSSAHERVFTAGEGWLIAERPLSKAGKEEEDLKYYYSSLGADVPLGRLASLAHSRWSIEQFYEDAKGECGLGDYQGRRFDGLHRHLALSMMAYSFLMLESSSVSSADSSSSSSLVLRGSFSPSVRHTTLPAIHRQVLMWLLEDLVLWLIETDQIKTFRPRRN